MWFLKNTFRIKTKKLESRKDELEIAIKDLDETYEQEMDSHQDIRVYVEEKVIKKEDEVDFMIDREEVTLFFKFYFELVVFNCNSPWAIHEELSYLDFFGNDFKMSSGILENVKRAENCIRFDFKLILVT